MPLYWSKSAKQLPGRKRTGSQRKLDSNGRPVESGDLLALLMSVMGSWISFWSRDEVGNDDARRYGQGW